MISREYVFGRRNGSMARTQKPSRPDVRGVPFHGRVVRLCVGQGHGFIRPTSGPDVYFHRADLRQGTSINDLAVGDVVLFELLDDVVSGPRALRVCLVALHT